MVIFLTLVLVKDQTVCVCLATHKLYNDARGVLGEFCFCLFDLILYVPSTIFQLNIGRMNTRYRSKYVLD